MKTPRILLVLWCCCSLAQGQDAELFHLSLEELLNQQVVSGTKKATALRDAPSAVFVMTAEDIRRSGARSLPDLLRLVPGVSVQHTESSEWALSIRGVNSAQANKMLILVDGRSVYNTAFGATLWETQDLLLEDISRIEIIRGPGASSWGANAVNGVVNIVTKQAGITQGSYLEVGAGSYLQGFAGARVGTTVGEGFLRVSGKFEQRDAFEKVTGESADDDWKRGHASFRYDLLVDDNTSFEAHGGFNASRLYRDSVYQNLSTAQLLAFRERTDVDDQYLNFKLDSTTEDSSWLLQTFLWRVSRDGEAGVGDLHRFDVNLQNERPYEVFGDQSGSLVWGVNYRIDWDEFEPAINTPTPNKDYLNLIDGFIELNQSFGNIVDFNAAVRLGHYYFAGTLVQPTARVLFHVSEDATLWTAVSQAARNPSTFDTRIRTGEIGYVGGSNPPLAFGLLGNQSIDAEILTAYEAGYRQQLFDGSGYFELTGFYNIYDDVIAPIPLSTQFVPGPPATLVASTGTVNAGEARTWGGEAVLKAELADWFKTTLSYSHIRKGLDLQQGAIATFGFDNPGFTRHLASAWFNFTVAEGTFVDLYYRYAGAIGGERPVPAYSEVDLSFTLPLSDELGLRIVGRNLLEDGHIERVAVITDGTSREVPRSGYALLIYRF